MICDVCKQNNATIIIKKTVNGVQEEVHYCENCAKQETINVGGQLDLSEYMKGMVDFSMTGSGPSFHPGQFAHRPMTKCPTCGLTFTELSKTVKLGCEDCYATFEDVLEPLVKRMHGKTIHTGKIAHSAGIDITKKREITDIQQQLVKAISDENYELAAEYRDMIKLLKEAEEE
jgi:protein arginine kinase activator